jgi:multicomponent Na+:H+ antiporter subunit G
MSEVIIFWIADGLILLGMIIMSIAIYGMAWMPDLYTRLHAASKAGVLGIIPLLIAVSTTGDLAMIFRAFLIGVFLLFTTPVAAHAIAQAAYAQRERMQTPGARDESGRELPYRTE